MRTELHYFLWIQKVFFCFHILYTCCMKQKFIYQEDNLRGMYKRCKELRCAFNCLEWHKELSHWPFFPFFREKKKKKKINQWQPELTCTFCICIDRKKSKIQKEQFNWWVLPYCNCARVCFLLSVVDYTSIVYLIIHIHPMNLLCTDDCRHSL